MKKVSSFQLIIIIVFIVAAFFGILVFSGAIPLGNSNSQGGQGTVVLWGTVKSGLIFPALEEFNNANPTFTVKYVEKSADSFDHDLLEALAAGTGPDVVFLPDELAYHYANKIATIPFTTFPLATFKNTFAGAGEVFLTSEGMLAFPLAIDPLMMYYNRSMLDASAVVYPPASWDDMYTDTPILTKRDDSNKIIKSAVALGHFENINHAKDIISALFMQTGNPVINFQNGIPQSALVGTKSLAPVLDFYTSFADPNKPVYSWNKSFPNSRVSFSREDVAFYFGFASELESLVNQNPNQNFFMAPIPQLKNATFKLTNAHVTGLAILSSSKNLSTAYLAASLMAGGEFANKFKTVLGVAPARRDLLASKPADAYSPIFYDSALYARSWLDPSPVDTDNIFRGMVNGVLSNNMTSDNAIKDANAKLNLLITR